MHDSQRFAHRPSSGTIIAAVIFVIMMTAVATMVVLRSGVARAETPAGDHAAHSTGAFGMAHSSQLATAAPKKRPPTGAPLPPLDLAGYSFARPIKEVRIAYEFAARHPEVLQYVPCFCGCEAGGHRANDDCFVASRDADGRVKAWEPHGVSCAICLDVARDAAQMYASGAAVSQIRRIVEQKYRPNASGMTPTPVPPTPAR